MDASVQEKEKHFVLKKYNLPEKVIFCKKCVISNQRPRIQFDEEDVCNACRYAERKKNVDWKKRDEELRRTLDRFRSKNGSHDVIVPCSGGKDSAWAAHSLKNEYGMNPLTVTWAPHIYTDIGWKNFQTFIHSGFDNILGTPDGQIHRQLTKLAFETIAEPFQPFITGVHAFPMQMAVRYNIPLIVFGENAECEYGGDQKNENRPGHDLVSDLQKHYFSSMGPDTWPNYDIPAEKLHFYQVPPLEDMQRVGLECQYFGYYKKWIPQENYYYAAQHTGFEANPDGRSEGTYSKYASLDDQIDGVHYWLMWLKFGIGRCTSDAAHEVRDGHLTREEAAALVQKYDGEFPAKYFHVFLDYCDITEDRFWKIVDKFRSPHLWKKVNGEWKLRHTVWGSGTDDRSL